MRIMALDYGSKTVGVALSDELMLTAQAFETIFRTSENKLRKTIRRIEEIIQEKQVSKIIIGKPLNMDGAEGQRVEKTKEFVKLLEKRTNIEIIWQDERLTSIEAMEILKENQIKKSETKKYIDQVAAMLILEEYMNNNLKK